MFTAEPAGEPRLLAGELWDLDGWARAGRRPVGQALSDSPTRGPDDLAGGFELSAAVLRHLQADPLLPAELLPSGWPGPALRRTYDRWDRRYREVLGTWGRAWPTAGTPPGPWPAHPLRISRSPGVRLRGLSPEPLSDTGDTATSTSRAERQE